ncbi:HAD-like protein [Pleurotus pulmonarius]
MEALLRFFFLSSMPRGWQLLWQVTRSFLEYCFGHRNHFKLGSESTHVPLQYPVPILVLPGPSSIMGSHPRYTALLCDLGDVLFSWSSETKTTISSRTLRHILASPTWFDYECGRLSEDECYKRVGAEFKIEPSEVAQAFIQARDSLRSNDAFIALIRDLKDQSQNTLRVYAMSNISLPDYEVLRTKPADWDIFDDVFTSGAAGERKPNLGFYKQVLRKIKVDPHQVIFVDDKLENVLSARSLGIHGIVFDDVKHVGRALRNLVGDPVKRGQEFLTKNARHLESVTDGGVELQENFAQLLILEATNDQSLVNLFEHTSTWNFFRGKGQLTTEEFPFDLDTTSLGITVTKPSSAVAHSVMDEMLSFVNSDGIIQTYFDHRRPRFDPVVCVNALCLFYSHGRGHELKKTLEWVHEVLLNRAYLEGTRYYETPECFLFFLSRLLQATGDAEIHGILKPLLRLRIQERVGADGDALALAMRVLVCDSVGLRDEVDLRSLLPLQCEDGGWEIGWIYKYGSSEIKIGNRGLTTALAINAITAMGPNIRHTSIIATD